MPTIAIFLLLLTAAPVWSLESPLILRPPEALGATEVGVVNPSLGTLQIYDLQGEQLKQVTEANFLVWLEFVTKRPADMGNLDKFQDWSALRFGMNARPSYLEWMKMLEELDPAIYEQAMNTEDGYWANEPTYDGTVHAAMTRDVVLVVVPSHYAILMVRYIKPRLELVGWHNYRSQLMVPTQYKSKPSREQLWDELPSEIKEEHEELEAKMVEEDPAAATRINVSASEPWIVPLSDRNEFFLLDAANRKAILYQYLNTARGGQLTTLSLRSLDLDLLIPTTYDSSPELARQVVEYNNELRRNRLNPVSRRYLEKLGRESEVRGDNDPVQANIDAQDQIYINFTREQMLFVYDLGQNRIELEAARNYGIEAGIARHKRDLAQRQKAKELLGYIEGRINADNAASMMRLVQWALDWDPALHREFEKSRSIRRHLDDNQEWQQALLAAEKAAAARQAEEERIARELAEEQATRR
ncbi:MAG: hypothetical protein ACOCYP_08395 [Planctomycetota bacterium]